MNPDRQDLAKTDDIIIQAAIRFFKGYYRNRRSAEANPTAVQTHLTTPEGIRIDGLIVIPLAAGENFMVAFEATTLNDIQEVLYIERRQKRLLDSVSTGFFVCAMLYSLLLVFGVTPIIRFGFWYALTGMWLVFFAVLYLFRRYALNLSRYRYIYAIEQFKQYKANEQWIVIDRNIFDHPENKYLEELKKQCIDNGFGLVMIDEHMLAHPISTPSRESLFSNRKQLSLGQLRKVIPSFSFLQNQVGLVEKSRNFMGARRKYLQFARYSLNSIVLGLFSLTLIIGLYEYERTKLPVEVIRNESRFAERLIQKTKDNLPEAYFYSLDTPYVEAFDFQENAYLLIDQATFRTLRKDKAFNWNTEDEAILELYIGGDEDAMYTYDCERLAEQIESKHIILAHIAREPVAAIQHMRELRDQGIPANVLWSGCVQKDVYGFYVFVELFFERESKAKTSLLSYKLKWPKTAKTWRVRSF